MEDLIDYILIFFLLIILLVTGLLVFLMFNNPKLAYFLLAILGLSLVTGIGFWTRKAFRKKRMGSYYSLFVALTQSRKEITKSVKKLERNLRKPLLQLFPKLNKLCTEAYQCICKIQDIDNVLASLETKARSGYQQTHSTKYYENLQAIEASKASYLHHIQEVLQFLQEFNSHILALRYSSHTSGLESDMANTLDELLIEMKALEEIT